MLLELYGGNSLLLYQRYNNYFAVIYWINDILVVNIVSALYLGTSKEISFHNSRTAKRLKPACANKKWEKAKKLWQGFSFTYTRDVTLHSCYVSLNYIVISNSCWKRSEGHCMWPYGGEHKKQFDFLEKSNLDVTLTTRYRCNNQDLLLGITWQGWHCWPQTQWSQRSFHLNILSVKKLPDVQGRLNKRREKNFVKDGNQYGISIQT